MTFKKQNSWKYLSVGLLGIIAIGLLTPVDAKPPSGQQDVNQFEVIFDIIADLQMQIDNVDVDDADSDPTNELQTISDNGGVTLSDGGGTVDCEDITGGPGLCDGIDAVVDADSSTTNEIQTLSETDGIITLSNSGGSVTVQERLTGNCAAGSSIRAIAADGTVTCETDDGGAGANFQTYVEDVTLTGFFTVTVQCDPGDLAIGGGFFLNNPDGDSSFPIDVNDNYVLTTGSPGVATGWGVSSFSSGVHTAIVVCHDNFPFRGD